MSAAYREIEQQESAFDRATAKFAALKDHLHGPSALAMTHGAGST